MNESRKMKQYTGRKAVLMAVILGSVALMIGCGDDRGRNPGGVTLAGPGVAEAASIQPEQAAFAPAPNTMPTRQPQATRTSTRTATPIASPTVGPTPTPTPVDCDAPIPQSTWMLPSSGATLSGTAHLRCLEPREAADACYTGLMAFAYSTNPWSGFYSFTAATFLPPNDLVFDTTVLPNGPYILYCSPMAYTGLWAPDPAPLYITIQN